MLLASVTLAGASSDAMITGCFAFSKSLPLIRMSAEYAEGHISGVFRKNQVAIVRIGVFRWPMLCCVLFDVLTAEDYCAGFQIQRHVTLKDNRSAKVGALGLGRPSRRLGHGRGLSPR
jgi:hypothetical protein